MNILNQLQEKLGKDRVQPNFVLAPFTTFKMGGPAEFYYEAKTLEELVLAVKTAHDLNLKLTLLGGISNVVVSDEGVQGLVVRNRYSEKEVSKEEGDFVYMKVSSGYSISALASQTAAQGLSGLEYHLGLPGSVGGAIYMNSKWTNPLCYVGDVVDSVFLINKQGETRMEKKDYFKFAYDYSILHETHEIVGYVIFKFTKDDAEILIARGHDAIEYRKKTQPYGIASSGCFFQNIDGESAGKLLDELGFKGFRVGDLEVSTIHANFIVNNGNGTVSDFKKIVESIKQKALQEKGLILQEEIKFIQ